MKSTSSMCQLVHKISSENEIVWIFNLRIKYLLTYSIIWRSHINVVIRRYLSWIGIEIIWASVLARSFISLIDLSSSVEKKIFQEKNQTFWRYIFIKINKMHYAIWIMTCLLNIYIRNLQTAKIYVDSKIMQNSDPNLLL
jgi:hypothetical protein